MKDINLDELLAKYNGNKSNIAKLFGVSRQAVNYWFKQGSIPKLRLYELRDILNKEDDLNAN